MADVQKYQSDPKKVVENGPGTAAGTYTRLESRREPFLRRARQCSELTLPYLIPPEGWDGTQDLYTPFQGLGARGVNNLASKMLLALFPPNTPCFRMQMSPEAEQTSKKRSPEAKTKIEEGFADYERAVTRDLENSGLRNPIFEGLKHKIVGGNVMLYQPDEKDSKDGYKVYPLTRYVTRRDPMGNHVESVVMEEVSPAALPPDFYAKVKAKLGDKVGEEKTCKIYTHIRLVDNMWEVNQEVYGSVVPDSEGSFPKDECPWLPLRFITIDGEDYGRGYVEEYLGDLKSLEGLSQSIVEGSAAAAKILGFVDPSGTTRLKDVKKAHNGDFVQGKAGDVTFLQLEKFHDLRVARDTADGIERRLSFAFLLNQSVQRQGERVTAEEIRYLAQELEDALGGIYSLEAKELQLPIIKLRIKKLEAKKVLPELPEKAANPVIVTGLEALGRGHDAQKLDRFISRLTNSIGPELVGMWLNVPDFIGRAALAEGLDKTGLINTPEQVAQVQQQRQMAEMVNKLGPEAMKQFGVMQGGQNSKQGGPVADAMAQVTGGQQ